jgi:hypothetical protein
MDLELYKLGLSPSVDDGVLSYGIGVKEHQQRLKKTALNRKIKHRTSHASQHLKYLGPKQFFKFKIFITCCE